MRIGSLFAGIGGFDFAAESLGWSTAWVSEIDPFACAVLAHHFPHARNLGDITVIDWTQVEPVDVLCAGFPCQPHSLAGKRQASDDSRDLWGECVRAVSLLRPRYFVGENVSGLLTSEGGRFFNRVVSNLAALGYAVEWGTLSAAECGAPHQRSRIFIVAYPADDHGRRGERGAGRELEIRRADGGRAGVGDADSERGCGGITGIKDATNADASRQRVRLAQALPDWSDAIPYRGVDGTVRLIPQAALAGIEPSLRTLADRVPDRLAGRDRGGEEATQTGASLWPVTESEPGRVAKLRAIGNAVVPAWVAAGPFAYICRLEAESGVEQ